MSYELCGDYNMNYKSNAYSVNCDYINMYRTDYINYASYWFAATDWDKV